MFRRKSPEERAARELVALYHAEREWDERFLRAFTKGVSRVDGVPKICEYASSTPAVPGTIGLS